MEPERHNPSEDTQHYSPEEMMARLKKNERHKTQSESRQDRELITREDGTQVVKVRRRKRRSRQPGKHRKKTNPKIKWAILGTVVGTATLLIVGSFYIIAKYNGAAFKKETEANITQLSGASQVDITQLRVTPATARIQKVEITWDQYSFLESAVLQNIEADIRATSFITSSWTGEQIVSEEADIFLKAPLASAEIGQDAPSSQYEFGSYRCDQLNLHFGISEDSPVITGMRASLGTLPDGRSQIIFNNGTLLMKGWPELKFSTSVATINSADVELNALLTTEDARGGELQIKGRIYKTSSKPVSLDIIAKKYPIQELLGEKLGRFIHGQISSEMGSLDYHYSKPSAQALSFVMPFNSSEIQMAEFPMFTDLKELTGNSKYTRPIFNDCNATLKRTSDSVTLDDIKFNSTNLISLSGKISILTDGKMSGKLSVQLPIRLFDAAKVPPSFSGSHDGVYTVQVTIGGTIHNPHDNLHELLKLGNEHSEPPPAPKEVILPPTPVLPPILPSKPLTPKEKEKEFEELLR